MSHVVDSRLTAVTGAVPKAADLLRTTAITVVVADA